MGFLEISIQSLVVIKWLKVVRDYSLNSSYQKYFHIPFPFFGLLSVMVLCLELVVDIELWNWLLDLVVVDRDVRLIFEVLKAYPLSDSIVWKKEITPA